MSKAPEFCLYCDKRGNSSAGGSCGFCVGGKPLDTQEDWDRTWGKLDFIFVCENRDDGNHHRVKWNSGEPFCLSCEIPAVSVCRPKLIDLGDGNGK